MPSSPSIESLELRRADIANQISALGDLRSGSITTTFGRCGKPTVTVINLRMLAMGQISASPIRPMARR